jgi:hypothetical protein
MGWDILAYVDIDQSEVEEYIKNAGLDKNEWKHGNTIAEYFRKKLGIDDYMYYTWNDICQLHELFFSYRVTFIRNDDRFTNIRYQIEYQKRTGKDFPRCLTGSFLFCLHDRHDAVQIASALRDTFSDDEDIAFFAKWLDETARICKVYELSY